MSILRNFRARCFFGLAGTFFLLLATFSVLALAQTEVGQIEGTVTDSTGAVVAGAKVTATSVDKGSTRSYTTSDTGRYVIPSLLPGSYQVTAAAPNFATAKRMVTVSVGSTVTSNITLAVATSSTTVEVSAEGGQLVQTESQQMLDVITTTQIAELPTLTRNPYDLVAIAGNVQKENGTTNVRGAGYSINGQRAASTDIQLDGAQNVDLFTASVGQSVPLDSVQEFSVISNNFGAEYGRASGGIVNVVTKSGTNSFHGSGYEFNRLSAYTANTFDNNATGTPKGKYTRNQFGYTIGGPAIKNKLFFFDSTEWVRVRSAGEITGVIPDPAFISAAAANTQAFFTQFGKLRPGLKQTGVFTQSQVAGQFCATTACPHLQALPANTPIFDIVSYATGADAGGGSPQNNVNQIGRVDFNISDKTQLMGRYGYNKIAFAEGSVVNSPYAGFDSSENDLNQNFLISLTHLFSPNFISVSKASLNRLNQAQPLGANPVGPTLYMSSSAAKSILGRTINLPGYSQTTPGNAIPFGGPQNVIQLSQGLQWTHGKHQFKFGGEYIYARDNRAFGAYQEAVEGLGSSTAQAMDNFLTGNLAVFKAAISPQGELPCRRDPTTNALIQTPACTLNLPVGAPVFSRSNRYNDLAFYGQDSWKIKPHLTLNFGLRWEYYGVQHNKNPNLDSNFVFGTGSTLQDQIANGNVFTVPKSPVGALWAPDKNNFAPRIGFAWDIFGDGKTSLRGGFGMSYERNFGNVTFNLIQNPPAYAVVTLQAPSDFPSIAITNNNFGPLAGSTGTKAFLQPSLRYVRQDIGTAYAQFWSASLERQIARNTVASVDYSGSRGVGLYTITNYNKPGFGMLYEGYGSPAARLNLGYGDMNTRGADGFSSYHAAIFRVTSSNVAHLGLTLNASYTLSHAIDNLSTTFSESTAAGNLGILDPFNPRLDKGSADFDARHRVSMSAVWQLPIAKGSHGFMRQVLGGWEVAPIFSARTGNPYTIFDCTNEVDDTSCARFIPGAAVAALPQVQGANLFSFLTLPTAVAYADPLTGAGELPACPAPGSKPSQCKFPAGMSGRNAYRGPGIWNLDFGIYKNFSISERVKMQFRSEFFDALNHSNLYVIGGGSADASATSFIQAKRGTDNDPAGFINERRFIQFALKVSF
jgi:outer membrane receptor protein involved in Fe transport